MIDLTVLIRSHRTAQSGLYLPTIRHDWSEMVGGDGAPIKPCDWNVDGSIESMKFFSFFLFLSSVIREAKIREGRRRKYRRTIAKERK